MTLDNEFFRWVRENSNTDPATLRLRMAGKNGPVDYSAAITQIECRRKFATKLARTLAAFPDFYFPSVLAGEQASSDLLAEYHSSLVAEGLPAVDLTAGLGIDAFHISQRASETVAVEMAADRTEALRYNAEGLHASAFTVIEGDCIEYIESCIEKGKRFAFAFIDPARRAADGSRVFALSDCAPDVVSLLPKLAKFCRILVIKASPMLDISHTLEQLGTQVISVTAVGTPTECKELMITLDFDADQNNHPIIEAVTLTPNGADTFAFTIEQEKNAPQPSAGKRIAVGDYLYEPSPAMMKCGASKLLASRFGLQVFHANTRLFYSDNRCGDFPGDCLEVVEVLPYASKVIKRFKSKYPVISVAARNFGLSADALRTKLGVRDGGEMRVFGLTDGGGEKLLIVARPSV